MIMLYILATYLIIGMAFSAPFLFNWIYVLDEGVDRSWLMKLFILPGCIVLWPVLVSQFLKSNKNRK
jgi:hypothetical protein